MLVSLSLYRTVEWCCSLYIKSQTGHATTVKNISKGVATAHGRSHGKKYSYSMLSQLFSGFGTHGSVCKKKTFLGCWEWASCSVLNNTVLLYYLVAGRVGGEIIET